MSTKETSALLDKKEKRKAEKVAKTMAGFDLGGEVFSDNERMIREAYIDWMQFRTTLPLAKKSHLMISETSGLGL